MSGISITIDIFIIHIFFFFVIFGICQNRKLSPNRLVSCPWDGEGSSCSAGASGTDSTPATCSRVAIWGASHGEPLPTSVTLEWSPIYFRGEWAIPYECMSQSVYILSQINFRFRPFGYIFITWHFFSCQYDCVFHRASIISQNQSINVLHMLAF